MFVCFLLWLPYGVINYNNRPLLIGFRLASCYVYHSTSQLIRAELSSSKAAIIKAASLKSATVRMYSDVLLLVEMCLNQNV